MIMEILKCEEQKGKKTEEKETDPVWSVGQHQAGHLCRVPEGQAKVWGAETPCEQIMAENFPNLIKDMSTNVHNNHLTPR